jgi:hypothetical protein
MSVFDDILNSVPTEHRAIFDKYPQLRATVEESDADRLMFARYVGEWVNWRDKNWDSEVGMTHAEKALRGQLAEAQGKLGVAEVEQAKADTTGLSSIDDDVLVSLARQYISDAHLTELIIREYAARVALNELDESEVHSLFNAFVRSSLRALWDKYIDLWTRFWDDKPLAAEECRRYVQDFIDATMKKEVADLQTIIGKLRGLADRLEDMGEYRSYTDDQIESTLQEALKPLVRISIHQPPIQSDPPSPGVPVTWPWPITTPPEGTGAGADIFFPNKYSGLWLCGYRVGKSSSLTEAGRRTFLDYFFRNPLPAIVSQYHDDNYGEPGSEKRLQKMANVIAANCRNFKKNDRDRYEVAISDYEQDMAYLKQKYYDPGSFPWPPTED